MNTTTCAIVLAADRDEKLGSAVCPPFLYLHNRPVLAYALSALSAAPEIDSFVVAIPKDRAETMLQLVKMFGYPKIRKIVAAPARRTSALLAALEHVPATADWVCLLGGSNMYIEIFSTAGDFFPAGKPWQTTLVAEVWNAEMRVEELEIGSQYISWQRISSDRQGDIAWNIQHATGEQGLRLDVDSTVDVPGTWETGSQISFQIDISLPELPEVLSARYSIIM